MPSVNVFAYFYVILFGNPIANEWIEKFSVELLCDKKHVLSSSPFKHFIPENGSIEKTGN